MWRKLKSGNNLLGGQWIYRRYVRIKGGQTKCEKLRTRGEGGWVGGLILVIFVRTYYVNDTLLLLFTKPFFYSQAFKRQIIFLIRLLIQGGSLSSNVTVTWGKKFRIISRTVLLKSITCLFTSTLWNVFSQPKLAIERWVRSKFPSL